MHFHLLPLARYLIDLDLQAVSPFSWRILLTLYCRRIVQILMRIGSPIMTVTHEWVKIYEKKSKYSGEKKRIRITNSKRQKKKIQITNWIPAQSFFHGLHRNY